VIVQISSENSSLFREVLDGLWDNVCGSFFQREVLDGLWDNVCGSFLSLGSPRRSFRQRLWFFPQFGQSSTVFQTTSVVPTLKTRRNSRFLYGSHIIPGMPPICGGIPPPISAAGFSSGIS